MRCVTQGCSHRSTSQPEASATARTTPAPTQTDENSPSDVAISISGLCVA
jgi:hypothetical protein